MMKVGERYYRSIWHDKADRGSVHVIDQRRLPFAFEVMTLRSVSDVYDAIREMAVRGSSRGAAAAWGVYLSFLEHSSGKKNETGNVYNAVISDAQRLKSARPTAVNLAWAVDYMTGVMKFFPDADALCRAAEGLCDEEAERSRLIRVNGLRVIEAASSMKGGETVNI